MMETAAHEKAISLRRYALAQGAKLDTFQLALSLEEGIELLDWLEAQNPDNELLRDDVAQAKLISNPWAVLENFALLGFLIVPLRVLH